jgi:hypothetical protein
LKQRHFQFYEVVEIEPATSVHQQDQAVEFSRGGEVPDPPPGSPPSASVTDSIATKLTPHEMVVNVEAAEDNKPLLEKMNAAGLRKRAAAGAERKHIGGGTVELKHGLLRLYSDATFHVGQLYEADSSGPEGFTKMKGKVSIIHRDGRRGATIVLDQHDLVPPPDLVIQSPDFYEQKFGLSELQLMLLKTGCDTRGVVGDPEIATSLSITRHTVRHEFSNIYNRIDDVYPSMLLAHSHQGVGLFLCTPEGRDLLKAVRSADARREAAHA